MRLGPVAVAGTSPAIVVQPGLTALRVIRLLRALAPCFGWLRWLGVVDLLRLDPPAMARSPGGSFVVVAVISGCDWALARFWRCMHDCTTPLSGALARSASIGLARAYRR
jgi:hypothetical protein